MLGKGKGYWQVLARNVTIGIGETLVIRVTASTENEARHKADQRVREMFRLGNVGKVEIRHVAKIG